MHCIQEMTNLQLVVEPDGTRSVMAPVISPKLATAATFSVPACESCLLGRAKKRSPGIAKVKHVLDKEGILARDKYEVGDFSPLINLLYAHLEDFQLDMGASVVIIVFMEVPFIMMPRLV